MKKVYITVLMIIYCIASLKSQSLQNGNLDPQTGYWNTSLQNNSPSGTDNSLVYTWQSVTLPQNVNVLSLMFVDTLNGWLSHNGNGAMRTTDGGLTWNLISFNDTNFSGAYNSTFFLNQNTGWCTGSAIQIRKTTNGGLNWFKQYGPPVAGIAHSIYFFDANTGFIFGSKNYPYVPFGAKTTNGGTNWSEIPLVFSGAQELNKQFWVNSSTGWIAGYDVLLKTTDGGTTFTNVMSNVPPTGNGHNDLLSVYFPNSQTGWLGGSNLEKHNIYVTTNAGASWTFQPNPVSINNAYAQINDVQFLSSDSGWAVHGTPFSGAIMFTTNGGTNWLIEDGNNTWFNSLSYVQRLKAWCGATGTVFKTSLQQPVEINNNGNEVPKTFSLYQNYPNPFNPTSIIRFDVPPLKGVSTNGARGMMVHLTIYDALGREITTLVNENLNPGTYEVEWNAAQFSSGIYFYKLNAGDFSETKSMVLIK